MLPTVFVSSKIHSETDATNGRAARGRVDTASPSIRFESGEDSRRRAWLIEIQMSISSVRAYILTRRRGEERSECGVLFVSWMSKTVAWIAPMFALEFCRPMDGSSSKAAFVLSMLFYNHAFGNISRYASSLKIRTGSPPSNR